MNNIISKTLLISLLIFSFSGLFAQAETDSTKQEQIVLVKMKNGAEYKGIIISKDSIILVIQSINGEMNLIAKNIRSVERLDYEGEFEFENLHNTRYFFGPSGIPIKKGKGYYQNILATGNFVNYGITENISIGGGFEFISTVLGTPIWFLTPKVGFDISDKFHAGGGFIMAGILDGGILTLGYGVVTYGQAESNISIGTGYGFADGDLFDYPAIMVSGTHRVSNSIALLSENYVIPGSEVNSLYVGIQGIRIISRRSSFDIGVTVISNIVDEIPVLPFIGYVRMF